MPTNGIKKEAGKPLEKILNPCLLKEQNLIYSYTVQTPIGKMAACATDDGICLLEFEERPDLARQMVSLQHHLQRKVIPASNTHLLRLQLQLDAYFSKEITEFNLPLVYAGTLFQTKVWDQLRSIPFGETETYMSVTKKLGNLKAIRAVAAANGANKMAILIPCHRVVGTDGSMVGYAGGVWRKKWLINHESRQETLGF